MAERMNFLRTHGRVFRLMLITLFGMSSAIQAATVRAYVQPTNARPNQTISYIITVQDGEVQSIPQLRLPLQIGQNTAVSTSQQFSIINGRSTSSVRLTWGLSATEPGEFVIPPQSIQVNGETLTTNEVKLTVEQGGGALPNPGAAAEDDENAPILQVELGKKEIYQGEVVPINCSLYVPRQVQLRRLGGLIDIEKSDFAIARFPQQSEQTMTSINGVGYYVFTFRSTLSSLRTGDLQVGPASIEILVEVPVEGGRQQPNMFPPGFPPGFFSGVQTEPRKLVVKSQQVTLKVLPLPSEGKPANFSGAVGEFALTATASPTDLTVGDPVAVELSVEGAGNFDALDTPALTSPTGWKSYPAKRYNLEGQLDQNQVPTLERRIGYSQVFIPEAVHPSLPPFELNFFSPSQKKYITLRTEAIPLNMKPAPVTAATESSPGVGAESTAIPPPVANPQANITDIVVNPAPKAHWLAPTSLLLLKSTTFWTAQAVPVGMLALAFGVAYARRRRESLNVGRSGELRAAWAAFEEGRVEDAEYLRRAAQFIHVATGDQVTDSELQKILDRYQDRNFSAVSAPALSSEERRSIQQTLSGLFRRSLAKLTVILILLLGVAGQASAQAAKEATAPDEIYRDAVVEMEKGNFTRGQYLAESLLKKKPPQLSAEVFELIGHARYRQDDMGRAALWYQRAQLLNPRAPELKQNLRHLSERLRFLTFENKNQLAVLGSWLLPNEWILLATVGLWMVLLSLAWRVWVGKRTRAWPVVISVVGLIVALPSIALASLRPVGAERVKDISIVTVPEVRAYTAATVTSGTVIDLPPGSQVRVLEQRGAWQYVEIPDEKENLRGWVEGGALTPLWIWEPSLVP